MFPWTAAAGLILALLWAVDRGQLAPADFTFVNATEVKGLDPAIVTGQPEQNMLNALFEGLVRWHPETGEPIAGIAKRWEISQDKLTYTFHLRDEARWSDGAPITADDIHYSLRRLLDPRTAAENSYQAWYIKNAQRYSGGGRAVRAGDRVEVELNLPADAVNTRRGELLHGKLVRIERRGDAVSQANDVLQSTFAVAIKGETHRFHYADDLAAARRRPPTGVRWCRQVLLDFREVGVRVVDPHTVEMTLEHPTPYFLDLLGFYPLSPVQQACVERYGSPEWTKVENIVCNGAFVPEFRRIRDRTRLVKNQRFWDRENVRLNSVDVLAVESLTTTLNLYLTGQADWIYDLPQPALRVLRAQRPPRDDVNPQPLLNTYFYNLNTKRKPLDDVRVRRALSLAIDREEICQRLMAGGEQPAHSLVPPSMPGYTPAQCPPRNVVEARRLLAEAGYPEGRGFPTLAILYNTHEGHQAIAQLVRKQWQQALGISVRGRNEEWASYLNSQRQLQYDIVRRAWIADYPDPNTFLDMFVTNGEQNNTGWSRPAYDELIAAAAEETDEPKRLELFQRAERMLMDEQPIIPVYYYTSRNLVKPHVRGFYNNLRDAHPVWAVWLDREQKTPNPFLRGRP